ncbi:MAG TPA: DNA repair protein RadC [Acidobacteriota bacterium]|nr:DNA repair protein RadC [Acidobacteriota bacterium]
MNNGSEILDLLSFVLSRGDGSQSARRASGRLMDYFGSAQDLAHATLEEIRRAGRISPRQAESVFYALQLGKQVCCVPLKPGERFSSSRELYQRYRARFFTAQKEHFFSLQLNSKNQLIREVLISIGSLSTSVVHPREVFAPAVRDSSAALIFMHNHPSGDPTPSREDKDCTKRLIHAGQILGIRVLDHLVIGHNDYFSFADAGLLNDAIMGLVAV